MIILKKLIFAPAFFIAFFLLIYQISPVVKSYDLIFSISMTSLAQLIIISALVSLTSLLFVLFATIASDWRLILPIGIIGSLIPFIFLEIGLAIVFAVGILVSLLLSFLGVENSLKSYLTFQPNSLLSPSIKHLSGLLILSFCLVYFLSINKIVVQTGFQIPDSLIDIAIPQATQELANTLIKQTVSEQLQNFIKPYLGFVPAVLALLLFFTLQSLTSVINLLIYPLLWLIFLILEKTGFIKFTTEMRPVKKMVI